MKHLMSVLLRTAFVLLATALVAGVASAQQLKRVEVKATVTESQFGEVEVGKSIHVTAFPNDIERFAIPVLIKVRVSPSTITLEPNVQAQFSVTGNVIKSRISGIQDGDRMECTIDQLRLTCVRQRPNTASRTFRATLRDLLVVKD
ncbi:MAG TPA: hypothetical protein VFV34_01680 [Blastocatellia bacterium]|nr:hypothetical protein [Blastocatellia bacterium]